MTRALGVDFRSPPGSAVPNLRCIAVPAQIYDCLPTARAGLNGMPSCARTD